MARGLRQAMLADGMPKIAVTATERVPVPLTEIEEAQIEEIVANLQRSMWAYAGLLRQESTLREGISAQEKCEASLAPFVEEGKMSRRLAEAQCAQPRCPRHTTVRSRSHRKPRGTFQKRLSPPRRREFPEALGFQQ